MEESRVMEAAKTVSDQLDNAQSMLRRGEHKLCLAYMETVVEQGPVYFFATCALLSQGIVMETPECDCVRHGKEQCFNVGVIDARTMRPTTDPLYPFSSEIITAFSKHDWEGFVDRLKHVIASGRQVPLACLMLSRLTQLQDQKEAGLL